LVSPADDDCAIWIALGGFTTFSTFALDTVQLWDDGQGALAMTTVVISMVVGIGAAVGGLAIGRGIAR
jgi:CrcB protein